MFDIYPVLGPQFFSQHEVKEYFSHVPICHESPLLNILKGVLNRRQGKLVRLQRLIDSTRIRIVYHPDGLNYLW